MTAAARKVDAAGASESHARGGLTVSLELGAMPPGILAAGASAPAAVSLAAAPGPLAPFREVWLVE